MIEELKMYDLVFHCGDLFIYCGVGPTNCSFVERIDYRTGCVIEKWRLPKEYVSKGTNTYFGWEGFTPDGPKLDLSKLKNHNTEAVYAMLTSSDKDSFELAMEILRKEKVI